MANPRGVVSGASDSHDNWPEVGGSGVEALDAAVGENSHSLVAPEDGVAVEADGPDGGSPEVAEGD
jgi:hypothetical protein